MLFYYALTAIFIAWIWVDYYRLIDIYEPEKLRYFIFIFVLGGLSVNLVFFINNYLIPNTGFALNGNLINDFLYCTFKIGVVEEISKLTPFVLFYLLFKKEINEPIDVLAYVCISALGFSAFENILYFKRFGADIIGGRAILSTVAHMFFSAIAAYGIIRYQFKKSNLGLFEIALFFLMASASHGLYDFWLLFKGTATFGIFITVFFFLESISMFAVMLNNALNNSDYFTYKKVVNSNKVFKRLFAYYSLVFILQLVFLIIEKDFKSAIFSLGTNFFTIGFIIFITCIRMSRFKLIQGKWFPVLLQFPIEFKPVLKYDNSWSYYFKIRGDDYNETYLNKYYREDFFICPLDKSSSYIESPKQAYIKDKVFLKNDETFYLVKVYVDETRERDEHYLLKPKTFGKKFTNKHSPIAALLRFDNLNDLENTRLTANDFTFVEWVYAKEF